MNIFARFVRDESGATAIEYGLIAAGIAVAVIAAMSVLTPAIEGVFGRISATLDGAG